MTQLAPTIGEHGRKEVRATLVGAVVGGLGGLLFGAPFIVPGAALGFGVVAAAAGLQMRARGKAIVEEQRVFVYDIDGTPDALQTYGSGLAGLGAASLLVGGALTYKRM